MITESKFITTLDARCIDDDKGVWQLLAPLVYQSVILQGILTIPKDYKTDFASVPRLPIIYAMFGDRAHHESIPHDWIYGTHLFSKSVSDSVFLEAMTCRGKPAKIKYPMYYAVKFGGFSSYKKGIKKFIEQNPTITELDIKNSFVSRC